MAFKDLLGGLIGTAIEQGGKIADEFTLSKEEKEEFRQRDEDRLLKLRAEIESTAQARFAAVSQIITAEMQHGNGYTKNARPTIVYAGLFMFIVQMIGSGFDVTFEIPSDFIYTWGGVCGVWVMGRSAEKFGAGGVVGKAAGIITGNGFKVPEL